MSEIKKLCDYANSKHVVSLIDRVLRVFNDQGIYSIEDRKLVQTVLAILRHEIVHIMYEQYSRCIEEANLIINELEIEKSQR